MNSLDGISELHMSGARAVFRIAPGAVLPRAAVAAAFEANDMELRSFGEESRVRPTARYTADAGIT